MGRWVPQGRTTLADLERRSMQGMETVTQSHKLYMTALGKPNGHVVANMVRASGWSYDMTKQNKLADIIT